jgi:pilus assembly protein FimV
MKTAVRRVLLMSALMSPGALYALGLGEIHLKSALNQPFDAEIELVSATQEDLGALRATLATGDAFARYGLDRPAYLSDFNFRVTKGTGGRDVLRVTSPRPVTEPFVTLLVEANWPRGRLLREYTVLLDPPVFTPGPVPSETVATPRVSSGGAVSARAAEPVAQATAEAAVAPSVSAPATAAAPASTAPPAEAPRGIAPGSSYRVRPNDTLWRIASQVNPGSRDDVNRAMVSIYQNNPEAFDGNINVLRSGSSLRIPDAGQIEAVSVAAASAEVKRQYEAWRSDTASAGSAETGRLRLVTPEQGTSAPSTTVTPAPGASAPATTAAPPATAPSGDIEARVRQLEGELAEARRLLEVRNAELATLQGGAVPADGSTPPVDASGTPAGAAVAPAAEAPKTAEPAKPAKPAKKKKAPAAEPQGPTMLERAQEYWWVLLGLLVAGLGGVLFQRLRRERGTAEDSLEEALGRTTSDLRTTPRFTPRSRDTDNFVVEEKRPVEPVRPAAAAAATAAARPVESAPVRKTVTVADTVTGDSLGTTEASDPLAEADFHMAYGLYDQAADLVQLAIKREPQRRELKLKLLEIFFVWGNRDRFLETARELHSTRGDAPAGEWDKVLIMGKQIAPEQALFAGTPSGSDSLDMEFHSTASALDIDMSDMPAASTATDIDLTERAASALATDTGSLDFMLDEPAGDSQVAPTIETPRVRAEAAVGDTQELTVDNLGLDVDALRDLEALEEVDTIATAGSIHVEDTVETRTATHGATGLFDDELDLLSSTSLINALDESTALLEPGLIDLSESTGEMPRLDDTSATGITRRMSFDSGEPPTMSEVGTKLDLARAYMDMGDPEGARSILDEVLQEGNVVQKQEAERLIASLP